VLLNLDPRMLCKRQTPLSALLGFHQTPCWLCLDSGVNQCADFLGT